MDYVWILSSMVLFIIYMFFYTWMNLGSSMLHDVLGSYSIAC